MSKKSGLITKSCLLILIVAALFVSSCKKSTPPPQQPAAPKAEQKTTEAPAAKTEQPVAPAKVEEKKAEADKPVEAPKPETVKEANEVAKPAETPKPEPNKVDVNAVKPAPANTEGMVPIDIKLPKPVFIGTPQLVTVPNLEKVTGELRKPFYAPEGTTNVALNKPVTCNQEPIIGEVSMITDGDKEGSDGSFVEFGPGVNRVTIDLGAEYNIYAVVIWHYHQQARVYFDVIVQVADDPDFVSGIKTLYNSDINNKAGQGVGTDKYYTETFEGRLIDAKGVKGRYVRLYSNGNSSNEENHYIEVEVYGKPAK